MELFSHLKFCHADVIHSFNLLSPGDSLKHHFYIPENRLHFPRTKVFFNENSNETGLAIHGNVLNFSRF